MLENAEKIVLDAKNNKYTGPEGQFTIVIDDFDGKAVQAWHIETVLSVSRVDIKPNSGLSQFGGLFSLVRFFVKLFMLL